MSWESQAVAVPSVAMAIPGPIEIQSALLDSDKDKKSARRLNETDSDKEARKIKRRDREKLSREKETDEEREQRRKKRREQDLQRAERLANTPELEDRKQKRRQADSARRHKMTPAERDAFNLKRREMHRKRKMNAQEQQQIQNMVAPISTTDSVAIPQALSMMHSV